MNSVVTHDREQEARKTLTIRLPPHVYARVKARAKAANVSMNEWVKQVLMKGSSA
jgi:predicted HicB family RNase H-like nuclease